MLRTFVPAVALLVTLCVPAGCGGGGLRASAEPAPDTCPAEPVRPAGSYGSAPASGTTDAVTRATDDNHRLLSDTVVLLDTTPPETLPSASPLIAPPVERLGELFPGCDHTRELTEPFPCLLVCSAAGSLLGYAGWSDLAGTTTRGCIGPVPVRVFVAPDGGIIDFDVLDNFETPSYLQLVFGGDFRARLTAWRPDAPDSVDAVSMATLSSRAIIRGVTGTARRIHDEIINPPPEPVDE